jgi:hypothetical protein
MVRAPRPLLFLCAMLVAASACDFKSTSTGLSSATAPDLVGQTAPSYLGTWRSVAVVAGVSNVGARTSAVTLPIDLSSCSNFQWTVDSQTSTQISGQFSVVCANTVVISATGTGTLTSPTTVALTIEGTGTLPGTGPCTFAISSNGTLNGDVLTLPYTGTSCLGPFSGTQTLTRKDLYPDPPAADPPPPPDPPTPPAPPSNGDELDLSAVTVVLGADLRGWALTSTMTSAAHSGSDLCTYHTMAGRWPRLPWFGDPGTLVEGNQWMFAKINGRWYAGAGEWLRPGQTCKNIDGHVGQGAFGGTVMEQWTPSPGELIGVAVSTPARAGQWGTAERSNVVLIRW